MDIYQVCYSGLSHEQDTTNTSRSICHRIVLRVCMKFDVLLMLMKICGRKSLQQLGDKWPLSLLAKPILYSP